MHHRFKRLEKIIGKDSLSFLNNKKVLIVGVGGVGGYVVEALVRSNIGTIILIDHDIVDETNINRQIVALNSTIGKYKVEVLKSRINDINPNCKVFSINKFLNKENIDSIISKDIDYIIDACDSIETKKEIIRYSIKNNIKLISSMGTGNRLDPSKLEITKLDKTVNDPIAKILRKFVRDENIKEKITVLSSKELPIKIHDRTPGSNSFVPSSAGLLIASYVINEFLKENSK